MTNTEAHWEKVRKESMDECMLSFAKQCDAEAAKPKTITRQLKDFAEANYEHGYDVFVETWDDENWAGLVAEHKDIRSCKREMKLCKELWLERQGEF